MGAYFDSAGELNLPPAYMSFHPSGQQFFLNVLEFFLRQSHVTECNWNPVRRLLKCEPENNEDHQESSA